MALQIAVVKAAAVADPVMGPIEGYAGHHKERSVRFPYGGKALLRLRDSE